VTQSTCDRGTIGDGARVGPFCVVQPGAEVGPDVVIPPHSVVALEQ
jgi:acyl-[acyl carrier protein]--UDP-N-acetylglucosamine O-acyltransferase